MMTFLLVIGLFAAMIAVLSFALYILAESAESVDE